MKYKTMKYRDLSLIDIGDKYIVVATDSCGGIGEKQYDTCKLDIGTVVYNTARVAALEVMSLGADIISVVDSLSFEMNYFGEKVINRMKSFMAELDLPVEMLNGTTEDIWPTNQSGSAVTIVGIVDINEARINKVQGNEKIYLFGEPLIGKDVEKNELSVQLRDARKICTDKNIVEIVPIGSKGIRYEIDLICRLYRKEAFVFDDFKELSKKPGGPATCIIAFSNEDLCEKYNAILIGELR